MAPPLSYSLSHVFDRNQLFIFSPRHSEYHDPQMQIHDPIFSFFTLFFLALSLAFLFFFLYKSKRTRSLKTYKHINKLTHTQNPNPATIIAKHSLSLPQVVDEVPCPGETNPTHLAHSLLFDDLPSDSAKWASSFDDEGCDRDDPNSKSSGSGLNGGEQQRGKKKEKRKKAKKKKRKMNSLSLAEDGDDGVQEQEKRGGEKANTGSELGLRMESDCLYPFTSFGSTMQRKIKQQYDELVKCNESKKLTLAQVVQFANSLVDARNELQRKGDVIQRKFVITKALLCKADRSSFERLRQQIYKLEIEQRRLEEDAFVYNRLQQHLKLSPAYQKMLEIGACMEKAKSCELGENRDDEFADVSFEELLAQEKKDTFWKKNGKSRICSS